jgi:hypothetical protein
MAEASRLITKHNYYSNLTAVDLYIVILFALEFPSNKNYTRQSSDNVSYNDKGLRRTCLITSK